MTASALPRGAENATSRAEYRGARAAALPLLLLSLLLGQAARPAASQSSAAPRRLLATETLGNPFISQLTRTLTRLPRGRVNARPPPTSQCTRKLIGAQYFIAGFLAAGLTYYDPRDWLSPRDFAGHGTWCAGAAAGNGPVSFGSLNSAGVVVVKSASNYGPPPFHPLSTAPSPTLALLPHCWRQVRPQAKYCKYGSLDTVWVAWRMVVCLYGGGVSNDEKQQRWHAAKAWRAYSECDAG
ncbi:unnamed protein product [Closterium sp. NIES-64]|nr:unnamed protein product [Closterium sp. NIES-64]